MKGRGRESEKDSLQPAEVSSKSSSAANAPAWTPHHRLLRGGHLIGSLSTGERCEECDSIRALEAQLRDAQIDAAKERSLSEVHLRRKRVLEAENQQLKGQWPPDYNGLRARAENAEAAWKKEVALAMDLAARVRELEADDKNANGVKCVALLARAERAEGFLRMLSEGAHRSKYCICVAHEHLRALAWGKP